MCICFCCCRCRRCCCRCLDDRCGVLVIVAVVAVVVIVAVVVAVVVIVAVVVASGVIVAAVAWCCCCWFLVECNNAFYTELAGHCFIMPDAKCTTFVTRAKRSASAKACFPYFLSWMECANISRAFQHVPIHAHVRSIIPTHTWSCNASCDIIAFVLGLLLCYKGHNFGLSTSLP